jgi:hypothetical protein
MDSAAPEPLVVVSPWSGFYLTQLAAKGCNRTLATALQAQHQRPSSLLDRFHSLTHPNAEASSSRSAPFLDHRICWLLFMRRLTRKFSVPSVIDGFYDNGYQIWSLTGAWRMGLGVVLR